MALYNRYRPCSLDTVCGQEHVKLILGNQVKNNQVAHAYLFSGAAGTGKTTVARILAAMLNASKGPSVNITLEDPMVARIIGGKNSMDVMEVDAASNRGIDDIRELRDKVHHAPMEMRRKVYIIDECHQLTNEAWNALLKILEEPPEHVVFIFCTTDSKKVLQTIKTRCQCFEFKLLSLQDVLNQCKMIASAEKMQIEEEALKLLALSARGSLRNAISRLEKIAMTGGMVTSKMVSQTLGVTNVMTACNFVGSVIKRDLVGSMAASSDAISIGVPAAEFISMIADVVHDMSMARIKGYDPERAGHTHDEADAIVKLKEALGQIVDTNYSKLLSVWIDTLDKYTKNTVYSMKPQNLMNMLFVAMCLDMKEYKKGG
jgi:DNA polymerase-3 subunit gamma/tau